MIRKFVLLSFTLGSSLLFLIQLVSLQIFNQNYSELSLNNALEKRPVYPTRGLIYDRNGTLLVANQPVYDLMVIPENTISFDTLELISFLEISKEELIGSLYKARRFSSKKSSVVSRQISKEKQALFKEKIWKYTGFYFQKKTIRDYSIPIASNILGYTSEINPTELKNKTDYDLGEMIGRQGIEKAYEDVLRGRKGFQFFQKDRFNRIIGSYEEGSFDTPPEAANNLTLTIDAELQSYGASLMQNKRGGIVAIEPSSGEVLALVTAPSYDPNLLLGSGRSENFRALANDTLSKPLFDRGL